MPSPPLPQFPSKESAWLWVPFRTSSAVHQLAIGVVLASGAAYNGMRAHSAGTRGLHIIVAIAGAVLAVLGLKLVFRRGPALAADADGITATMTGLDRSRVPWELITGARMVGKNKYERAVVILTADPGACAKLIRPGMVSVVGKNNRKYGVSGAYYLMSRTLGAPAERVVEQINELAASLHADLATAEPATPPADTSRSSRPA